MDNKEIKPYKTALNSGNAYWMARLSKEIYTEISPENNRPDEKKILSSLKSDDSGFLSVYPVEQDNSEAALIEHDRYLCMVFRGTDERKDWLDNINVFPTKELFGEFHRGFWNATEVIWSDLYDKYEEKNRDKKRPLFITGHSLGGAMATIAAARFVHLDKPFISVYTFGQPRAMNRDAARIFNAECKGRFFRFQNNNDLVTRLPARFMGYSHVGNALYISEEKKIHQDPGTWFKFLDAVDGYAEALKEDGIDAIDDHNMDRYLKAIEIWDEGD